MSGRFELRLDEETLRTVDGWRSAQPDVPTRSEAIRRLIERGLRSSEDEPRLSGTEMLVVHLLCDVLKATKAKTDINLKFLEEALYGGHFWALRWDLSGIFHTHADSPEVVKEVVDALDMWDFIEGSYEKLDPQQKAQLAKEVEIFGKDPKFSGFDGNNETEHLGVARFLIDDMRRFSRFKGRELNSHMPTSRDSYRRMLDVFLPMRTTLHGGKMSVSQLAAVLSERVHPSRRKS